MSDDASTISRDSTQTSLASTSSTISKLSSSSEENDLAAYSSDNFENDNNALSSKESTSDSLRSSSSSEEIGVKLAANEKLVDEGIDKENQNEYQKEEEHEEKDSESDLESVVEYQGDKKESSFLSSASNDTSQNVDDLKSSASSSGSSVVNENKLDDDKIDNKTDEASSYTTDSDFENSDDASEKSSAVSTYSENADKEEDSNIEIKKTDSKTDQSTYAKEDSVLIEKDGKFELVDPKELKAEYFNLLGLPNDTKSKKGKPKRSVSPGRDCHSSMSKSQYPNIRSNYSMSQQQKDMKNRRNELIRIRKDEEKKKQKEEVEERRKAAERCFNAWLKEKTASAREKSKKTSDKSKVNDDPQRTQDAQRAFDDWLAEKQKSMKVEKQLEKLRLEDEAQAYIIRSREMCDRAFREWIARKKLENGQSVKKNHRKAKSAVVSKKKLLSNTTPVKRAKANSARYANGMSYATYPSMYNTTLRF